MERQGAKRYLLTDHVCRCCLGRIVEEVSNSKRTGVFRCADCGTELKGNIEALCCCGLRYRTGKNAGFRCIKNYDKTPEIPSEIVVKKTEK